MELVLQVCLADQQGLLAREADLLSGVRYAASCPGRARTLPAMRTRELGQRRSANMGTLWQLAIRFKKASRHALAVGVGLLVAAPCLRSNELPLGECSQRLDASLHQHHRTRPFSRRNCGFRLDLRVWRRRIEEGACRSAVRRWHGHRRRELHGLALSVSRV